MSLNSKGIRIVFTGMVCFFLGANLLYRFCTIFGYSHFVGGLFIFLGMCSLFVILFPKYLRTFLFFFGGSFFLFGFRSYDIQSQVFETSVVFVAIAAFIVGLRSRSKRSVISPLFAFIICYAALSMLSVLLLPLGHVIRDFWLFGWKTSLFQVANAFPEVPCYSLGGINRLILFCVLARTLSRIPKTEQIYKTLFAGVFVGAVFSSFIGILDFYGVFSLAWYRKSGSLYVLNSTFMNRGWFAEFVLVATPFILIGSMSKISELWCKILLLICLVVCELALILAGARAGWVTYPLILFFCWLFFYFSKEGKFESLNLGWKDLAKIAISVPVTIVISLFLTFQVLMPLSDCLRDDSDKKKIAGYSKSSAELLKGRAFRLIQADPRGRPYTWREGFHVGRESPVFGMGYESFSWHANMLSGIPSSHFAKFHAGSAFKKIHDTPHSIYFQLFVSGGIVGLCLWFLIIGYAVTILIVDLIRNKRLLNIPVIISIISFHIYGIFQSMQYIPMIWLLIFLNLSYTMTIDATVFKEKTRRAFSVLVKICAVVVMICAFVYLFDSGSRSLAAKYGLKVYARDQGAADYFGFYSPEKWKKGTYRWIGRRALVEFRKGGLVKFDLDCRTPDVETCPVLLTITEDGKLVDRIIFTKKKAVIKYYYLVDKNGGGAHKFFFQVSRTWNPQRMGVSEDVRHLGLAVGGPEFPTHFPVEGIGFYDWEKWQGGLIPGWTGDEIKYRWMGAQAFIPIDLSSKIAYIRKYQFSDEEAHEKDGLEVFLRSLHPDVGVDPVVVEIYRDKMLWKKIVFKSKQWEKIFFDQNEIKDAKVLGFKVSRTWNPSLSGISEDGRDLGLMVVYRYGVVDKN